MDLLAKFTEFFCRVLIRHYYNKFRKLIAKYSNDSKDHKGYKPKRILPFASVMLSSQKSQLQWWLPHLPWLSNCLSLLDMELTKWEWTWKCLTDINQYFYTITNIGSYWLKFFMTEKCVYFSALLRTYYELIDFIAQI